MVSTANPAPASLQGVPRAVAWDGRNWPLQLGVLALLVVDERRADPGALSGALRQGGCRAAIVPARRAHGIAPYPLAHATERLLGPGWPVSTDAPGQRFRQRLATSVLWRLSGRDGIAVEPVSSGMVDDVVADLGRATGRAAALRGFLVSGG